MLVGLFATLLSIVSILLILVVLVQRGRGGGLAGALGGMGGQSAFGTKAGDLFTKITIGLAFVWILLCIASVKVMSSESSRLSGSFGADEEQLTNPLSPESNNAAPPSGPENAEALPAGETTAP